MNQSGATLIKGESLESWERKAADLWEEEAKKGNEKGKRASVSCLRASRGLNNQNICESLSHYRG